MFNKLKSAAAETALRSALATYSGKINEKVAEITRLKPGDVQDDEKFRSYVVTPALLAVEASSSGATSLIPDFRNRFTAAMLHLRNELVVVDEAAGTVSLVPDYQSRVSSVLIEGFKQ